MLELIKIFDLSGKLLRTEERSQYYQNARLIFFKKQQLKTKIKTVRLLLMDSKGHIYLQKRSFLKKENSGLYDKTIGGHIKAQDNSNITVVKECAEELGIPATVVSTKHFVNVAASTNLSVIAILQRVDRIPLFKSLRMLSPYKKYIINHDSSFYLGYYDGSIKFVDGESSGIGVLSLSELKQELKKNPNKSTEDLKFMIKKYEKFIKPIKKHL